MLGRAGVSVLAMGALLLGVARLPSAQCILSNTPNEKACSGGCCANKSCCETSDKRTGLATQPLLKANFDQPNIASFPATMLIVAPSNHGAQNLSAFSSAQFLAHTPAPLALICIRLI